MFKQRYSMQERIDPSFLGANTTGSAHSDVEGSMTLALTIFSTSFFACSRCVGPALYGGLFCGLAPGVSSM